jgi:hypothetical protein
MAPKSSPVQEGSTVQSGSRHSISSLKPDTTNARFERLPLGPGWLNKGRPATDALQATAAVPARFLFELLPRRPAAPLLEI